MVFSKADELFMELAINEAKKALEYGDVPVGAIIVKDGAVIAAAHNMREATKDPTAHAEVLAIKKAAQYIGDYRLTGATMYVTLEPCPMCAGAILMARLKRLVYGASDPIMGCAGSTYRLTEDKRFGLFTLADGGLNKPQCEALIKQFYQDKRNPQ